MFHRMFLYIFKIEGYNTSTLSQEYWHIQEIYYSFAGLGVLGVLGVMGGRGEFGLEELPLEGIEMAAFIFRIVLVLIFSSSQKLLLRVSFNSSMRRGEKGTTSGSDEGESCIPISEAVLCAITMHTR